MEKSFRGEGLENCKILGVPMTRKSKNPEILALRNSFFDTVPLVLRTNLSLLDDLIQSSVDNRPLSVLHPDRRSLS